MVSGAAAGLVWSEWPSPPPPVADTQIRPAQPPMATEGAILARQPGVTETYRFASEPSIMVVQFAALADQAGALNRVAALIEKAGFPRDRVLDDAELDRRIRAGGDDPARFYYGHDYRAADLLRFFAAARQAGVPLTPGERWLDRAMQDWGWQPGSTGALITLVRESPELDSAARATILRHELSHGLYFTSPAYAGYARAFWERTLTPPERTGFRGFLASERYDTAIDDLVVNEAQAYLMHTPNERFFRADAIGVTPARLAELRLLFLAGMPPGWLRDCTPAPDANGRGK